MNEKMVFEKPGRALEVVEEPEPVPSAGQAKVRILVAGLAVSEMDRAREFYEGKLGLPVGIDSGDNVQYRCGDGSVIHVYLSPEHAGRSTATLAGWGVDAAEEVVDELASKGVVFVRYDEGPIVTDEKGIATFKGGREGRLLQGPGRQHPLDRPSAACLSAPGRPRGAHKPS